VTTLPCIVCDRALGQVISGVAVGFNHPNGGIAFSSPGHYGTTVFDPMNGDTLEINVCDNCLMAAGRRGRVIHHRPSQQRSGASAAFWTPPSDTDGSPEGPDPQGLDGEAATAGAGTASPETPDPHPEGTIR
jgi:hypothetical protein